jgi:DNA repair protein RadC
MRAANARRMLPQHRILSEGPSSMSERELLCAIIGERADIAAEQLLASGLVSLRRLAGAELLATMRESQAVRVLAALELGKRVAFAAPAERHRMLHARDLAQLLWARLAWLPHEEFWAVLLNARLEELRCIRIAAGGLTQCSVMPREAFAPVLALGAPLVAFAHNHPSGDPTPSAEDSRMELLLNEAGHALGVKVVDHLVLAEAGFHSAAEGRCPPPEPVSLVPRLGVG